MSKVWPGGQLWHINYIYVFCGFFSKLQFHNQTRYFKTGFKDTWSINSELI